MGKEGIESGSSEFEEATESMVGMGTEENTDMGLDDKQKGEANENEEEEDDEEEEEEEEECMFRFKDGMNPLVLMEDDASGVPIYQHLERLEYEALAEKKRKALADNHSEGSAKKARLEDLSGATMEEIIEAMNYGVRGKSRKYKKKGRRKGSKNKLKPEVTRMLGDATLHYVHGDYQEAISLLHKVIMQAPESSDAYHTLGIIHRELGDDKKAMDFYMFAAQLTPKDPSLWKELFTWSIKEGDTGRARYCLSRAITRDPKDADLKSYLASLYVELGDNQKAAESYEQLWQLCPEISSQRFPLLPRRVGRFLSSLSLSLSSSQGFLQAFFSVSEIMADLKMNHFSFQQNACEEIRSLIPISDRKDPVFCPKPRRVGILANNPIRPPFRWHMSHQGEVCDLKAGTELLDLIFMKEGYGAEQSAGQVASSPPYFCGSPPTRAANPLIQDARFGEEKRVLVASPSNLSSPSSAAAHKVGGCARVKFGLKPAAVRVEGFNCLNRDRQNSSIPAMA